MTRLRAKLHMANIEHSYFTAGLGGNPDGLRIFAEWVRLLGGLLGVS